MGIIGGGQCIYKSSVMDAGQFYSVLEHRRNCHARSNATTGTVTRKPSIDIDASQVAFRFMQVASGPAGYIYSMAVGLALCGIDVNIIRDPPLRHHSKRATVERKAKCKRARLKCIEVQSKLAECLQLGTSLPASTIKELEAAIAKSKSASEKRVPSDFNVKLQGLVDHHKKDLPSHGAITYLEDGMAQADIVIAARLEQVLIDAIVFTDTDFHVLLGDRSLCVKEIKVNQATSTIPVPPLLMKFANGSRVHSGLRLLKRSARHSIDLITPDVMQGQIKLCDWNGKMVFVLSHKVKALMRSFTYDTQVAFSDQELVACSCTCKCGSQNEERILDVHPLALGHQLVLLLFERLSQNFLVELLGRLESESPTYMAGTSGKFHDDVAILLSTTTCSLANNNSLSVGGMLRELTVGTALSKRCRGRPNPRDLVLLRRKIYQKPTAVAASILKKKD
jgi:hypothetical protein